MRKLIAFCLSLGLLIIGAPVTNAAPPTVLVTVVGSHGEPLANTAVQVLTPGSERFRIERTNARGEAQIALPEGFSFWIRAWAPGHAVVERPYVPGTDGPVVTLAAAPYRAALVGLVTDEKGRPVKEARVSAWLENAGQLASTTTGPDGVYQFDGLEVRDTYTIQVEAKGFQPFVQANQAVTAGNRNQLDIALTPASGPVTGEVINSRTGQPVGGVKAELVLNGYGVVATTVTDTYGYFHFAAPPWTATAYQVRLWHGAYETYTSAAFALNPGTWANLGRVSLNPLYAEVSGSVLDQSGQPLANTAVELQRDGMGTVETGKTGEDGFFAFANVPAGTYRVRAIPSGGQEHGASAWIAVTGGDRATADVAANSPDTQSYGSSGLVGTVRDHLGNPVDGATVTAARGASQVTAKTDNQGRYRLSLDANVEDAVNPDTSSGYHVFVSRDGFLPTDQQVVAGGGGQAPAMVNVRYKAANRADFTLQPATGQVAGRVLTDRGLPIAGVSVSLIPEGGGSALRATTDAAGRYLFGALPVGKQVRYIPQVTDDRYLPSAMTPDGGLIDLATVQPGATLTYSQSVRPRTTTVQGEVKAGADRPAAGATVSVISPAEGKTWSATVSERGTYSLALPTVPGRQYLVRAEAADNPSTLGTATGALDPGTDYGAVVNLAVVPPAALIGRVTRPDGKPAAQTGVTLWTEGVEHAIAQTTTDELGYYRFAAVKPGRRYSLTVWQGFNDWSTLAPGEAIISPLLAPGPGATIRADLQAPAGEPGQ